MATAPATTLAPSTNEGLAAFARLPYRRVVVPSSSASSASSTAATAASPPLPADRLPVVSEVFDLWQLGVFPVNQFVGQALCSSDEKPSACAEETLELVQLQANSSYQPHSHTHAAAVVWIIAGTGDLLLGGQRIPYHAHQRFVLPNGVPHGFQTKEQTFFLSIQSPPIIDKNTGSIDIHYDQANTVVQESSDSSLSLTAGATTAAATCSSSSSPATTNANATVQPTLAQQAPAAQPDVASASSAVAPVAAGQSSASSSSSSKSNADVSEDEDANASGGDRDIRLFSQRKGPGQGTGIPGNMGLDHVGFVVPNVREAADFLKEVFDCEFDWEVIRGDSPNSGERGWDVKFGLHPESVMPHVLMLKAGDDVLTQYIELFEFRSPDQYRPPSTDPLHPGWPAFSDIGNSYFSFTVKDLAAVMAHCKAKVFTDPRFSGCRFVQDPPMSFPLRGEVCNSTYLVSPWGQWIELTCWSRSRLLKPAIRAQQVLVPDARIGCNILSSSSSGGDAAVSTPSFVIDLDVVDHNISLLKRRIVEEAGMEWRIPSKAHKCPQLAEYIMSRGGACGVVLLTLREVELFADAGCKDIYFANQVSGAAELRRLTAVAKKVDRLRVSVDDLGYVRELAAAVEAWEILSPLEVLVELDVNHHRLGVGSPSEAVELARALCKIEKSTGALKFVGITGYEGHTPILPPAEKALQTRLSHGILAGAKQAIEGAGMAVRIVSGGGSCNYPQSLEVGVLNELQCGGAALCDSLYYDRAGLKDAGHRMAALVVAQVISAPGDDPTRATANAGFKAVGWHPFGGLPLLRDFPHTIKCNGLSAEHTRLIGVDAAATAAAQLLDPSAPVVKAPIGLQRGQRLALIPGYCDAMGSFWKEIIVVRRDIVVDVWKTIAHD